MLFSKSKPAWVGSLGHDKVVTVVMIPPLSYEVGDVNMKRVKRELAHRQYQGILTSGEMGTRQTST